MTHNAQSIAALYDNKFGNSPFKAKKNELYLPVNHIMSIPGKRIRPMLLLLSNHSFGGNPESALSPAYAMELFHNFSLVHDDIMDQADLRRGVPTVHKVFGTNAGILAGDVMLAYAYVYLSEMPGEYLAPVLKVFNQTAIEIFEGQQMDVDFEKRNDVTLEEYLKMIEYKTSVLLACSLQIGAILANASEEDQKLIYQFGLYLGLSFQIKDDLLDAFGDSQKVGKRVGGDILMNKKTYLYISTWQLADEAEKAILNTLLTEKNEDIKVQETKALMKATGGYDATLTKAEELYNAAIQCLRSISIPERQKEELYRIAEQINNRDY